MFTPLLILLAKVTIGDSIQYIHVNIEHENVVRNIIYIMSSVLVFLRISLDKT